VTAGYAAYARNHGRALAGRDLEAEALLKAVRLLDDAEAHAGDAGRLARALDYNLKLWTVFEADVSAEANPLPADVKRDLLRLCRFMDGEIARAVGNPGAARLGDMIAVNRNLAAGLMSRG